MSSHNESTKYLLYANLLLFFFSFAGVLSKLAALEGELNFRSLIFYAGVLIIMALYAFFWQQLIKKLSLTVAYSNRAVTVIWGALWGILFFQEILTPGKLLGIFMVFCGILLFSTAERKVK